ncbi:Kcnh2 [Symbiodinium sp. CCMP2456]|nr:Kcnh2 [Symbiodinium sp. CCMP2456]
MQLSAAISHLQLGLSNLRAVIQDNPLGEAERRELREIGRDLQHLATVASERVALPCDASRPEIRTYELQEETFERSPDLTCSIGLQLENQQSFKPSEHFTDVAVDKFPSIRSQQRSEISPKAPQKPGNSEARSPRRASLDSRASEVSEAEESDADHGEDSTYTYSAASHISRGTENDDNFEEGGPGLHQALQNQREVLMGLFKRLDTDGSGVIDTEELQRALRSVGQHPARAQKLIAAADENCNGKVEIDEWKNVVNRLVAGKGSGALKVFASALMEHEYGKYGERIQHSSTWNWDETRCKPWRWFLSCHSSTRLAWDVLLLVLLCYIAVVLPFTLAYLTESGVHGYINVGIDVCFLFDIFLNFRTTYINEAGEEVRSNRLIAKNYLTSWFSLDLVTALPLEHLVDGVPGQVESVKLLRGSKIFKILKVIRAIKLIKIFRASELGSRVEDFVTYEFKPESTTSQYISSLYWAMTTVTTAVELKVRIADAQGLRLQRGGEIRLVITLCTSLDREGAEFGAKVTPWLPVPPDEAPQWKAREAIFRLPQSRCFEAEFVDSAHLHIALMQKGAEQPEKTTLAGAALGGISAFKQGGFSALRSHAAASASALPLGGFQNERGDLVGSLKISVGRRLACAEEDGGPTWLQLLDVDGRNVKGQLLVDFPQSPPTPAPAVTSPPREKEPQARRTEEAPRATDEPRQRPPEEPRPAWESRPFQAAKPDVEAESSTSEGPMPLPLSPPRMLMSSASSSADGEADAAQLAEALAEQLSQLNLPRAEVAPLEWSSQSDQETHDTFSSSQGSEVNIFNINDAGRASRAQVLKDQLMRWSKRAAPWRFSQRLHSAFDREARQGRREVRKWRQRHEVFCLLNEIEQHLNDVVAGLRQADSSMRRFCRSHGSERLLQEASRLPAFLCDAALYYKSEAGVPGKLEDKLCKLERVADDFRAISIDPSDMAPEQIGDGSKDPGEAEDLQIDIAVLLESTLMAASQALGEYKKMHCRLELVATEYEPLCRLELSNATRPATFLPLLAEDAAVTLPDQAIVWAQDFSQLVDQASQSLATLVRELASRKQHLSGCVGELRALLLRRAAGGEPTLPEG